MTTPTITEYLKYANLQMAAEAFIRDPSTNVLNGSGDDLVRALKAGNNHASVFTETQAKAFSEQWEVVDQVANTPSGFSGTLFRSKANPNELVISFRSTEFVDDAIRDSLATNTLEVFDTGFAWGQMADMEAWYAKLRQPGGALNGKQFSVTGYSLGGHLATAFNLLHPNEAAQVVTFNGAGVGQLKTGTLSQALAEFNTLRGDPAQLKSRLFTTPELAALYEQLRTQLTWTAGTTTEQAKAATEAALQQVQNLKLTDAVPAEYQLELLSKEKTPLLKALNDMLDMQKEAIRIQGFTAGGTGADANTSPVKVLPAQILAETLDYRLAVGLVAERTSASGLAGEIARHLDGNKVYGGSLANQFDVVGTETTTPVWSAVANSQWHYGTDVKVFIEDQPFTRGNITESVVKDLFDQGGLKLLQNQYGLNNFADDHSLVLIVDSLTIQNTLLQLVPQAERERQTAQVTAYLKAASALKASSASGTQGKAEGANDAVSRQIA